MSIHITEDEFDKKIKEMREKRAEARRNGDFRESQDFDRFTVKNPKPGKYYRGVKNDDLSIARAAAKGLVPVPASDDADWLVSTKEKGLKVNGGQALFEMPREKHLERRVRMALRQEEMTTGFMEAKKEEINRFVRNELRGKPHTNYAIDTSSQGETQTATVTRVKQ